MLYIFMDIDGTIADATERFKKAGAEPSRNDKEAYLKWVEAINTGMEDDVPVGHMAELCKTIADTHHFFYLTGREEKHRAVTVNWLEEMSFPESWKVIMRPNGNWQEMAEFKENAIKTASFGATKIVVFDDDERGTLEKVCKRNGWIFLKARSGGQK